MARPRNTPETDTNEATEAQVQSDTTATEATEAQAPTDSQSAEQTDPNTPPADAETKSDDEVDLDAFTEALNAAVEGADSTGQPQADDIKALQVAYHALPGTGPKGKARKLIKAGMKQAVDDGTLEKAKAYFLLDEDVKSTPAKEKKEKKAKEAADPNVGYLDQRTILHVGFALLVKPEGLADDIEARAEAKVQEVFPDAQKYIAWLQGDKETRGDEPEVSPVAKAAAKLAVGTKKVTKSGGGTVRATGGGYSGPPRNVKAHIASAFANVPVGTFLKISEIAGHSSQEYGDDHPSPGAIVGSLASAKFDVPGVQAAEEGGRKGARKVA